ncbi:unnamed protein product, partial [Symbiodinium sp. CCMP2456]
RRAQLRARQAAPAARRRHPARPRRGPGQPADRPRRGGAGRGAPDQDHHRGPLRRDRRPAPGQHGRLRHGRPGHGQPGEHRPGEGRLRHPRALPRRSRQRPDRADDRRRLPGRDLRGRGLRGEPADRPGRPQHPGARAHRQQPAAVAPRAVRAGQPGAGGGGAARRAALRLQDRRRQGGDDAGGDRPAPLRRGRDPRGPGRGRHGGAAADEDLRTLHPAAGLRDGALARHRADRPGQLRAADRARIPGNRSAGGQRRDHLPRRQSGDRRDPGHPDPGGAALR